MLSLFNEPKEKKIGIDSIFTPFSSKKHSHRAGWAFMLLCELRNQGYENAKILGKYDKWNEFDSIIIDWGMEFKGAFNLFNANEKDPADRVQQFIEYPGQVYSLHIPFPTLAEEVEKRGRGKKIPLSAIDLDELKLRITRSTDIDNVVERANVVLGDSHALSMYRPGHHVMRNDGQTLHGALKLGLSSWLPDHVENLVVYFGNIDIRHHLARLPDPMQGVRDLVEKYEEQLKELKARGIKIEVVEALPIEDSTRQIPKSGYYKGTGFFGDWDARNELKELFNELVTQMCRANGFKLYRHPEIYKDENGKLRFEVMEQPRSVHISPEFYYWDMWNNEPNRKLGGKNSKKPKSTALF